MRTLIAALIIGLGTGLTAVSAAAQAPTRELRLAFNADGTVNLAARNVTTRDILAEWARQCQCHVVNAQQLPGGAIMTPIQFENAPQSQVLQSLLRSAAGYVLTPRRPGAAAASDYDTIFILATSNPVAGPSVPPPTTMTALPTVGSPDDELPPVAAVPMPGAGATADPTPPGGTRPSNPFVRSGSPFTSQPSPTATAPGTVTPVPQTPAGMPAPVVPGIMQTPAAPTPPRPGTVVPIVAVPQSNP